jgi:xanthine dehydrogenase accessory factor
MFDDFLSRAGTLRAEQRAFAVALVIRCDPPVSGKPGDKAIIQADGRIWGWVGGGCVQPLIRREALKALQDGAPRLVRIAPSAPSRQLDSDQGTVYYTMTCQGGGSLEIYIEPVLPKPLILILGRSLVAQTLAKLSKTVGYRVEVVGPGVEPEKFPEADFLHDELSLGSVPISGETYVVVSTQGEHDEEALRLAVGLSVPYVSFVASHAKAEKVMACLADQGITANSLSRVKAPAGLDLGHLSPEEIAVSILAEIIQLRRRQSTATTAASVPEQPKEATDPVCGMVVDTVDAEYTTEYEGKIYYFCCTGCKRAFDKEPGAYVTSGAVPAPNGRDS